MSKLPDMTECSCHFKHPIERFQDLSSVLLLAGLHRRLWYEYVHTHELRSVSMACKVVSGIVARHEIPEGATITVENFIIHRISACQEVGALAEICRLPPFDTAIALRVSLGHARQHTVLGLFGPVSCHYGVRGSPQLPAMPVAPVPSPMNRQSGQIGYKASITPM